MIKNEVIYERDITASYMKLPALCEDDIDVRIMLHHVCKGLIPVERCFFNGEGQFWYNISGKQALDSITKLHAIEYSVFERVILRICEQLEILEWNLMDPNGILLDPEFIFLSNKGEEVSFIFYPQKDNSLLKELQKLVEYLLAKLDHSEHERIQGAYEIYEMILQEECQIQELKDKVLKNRIKTKKNEEIKEEPDSQRIAENEFFYKSEPAVTEEKSIRKSHQIEEKLSEIYKKAKDIFVKGTKEDIPTIVYPQEEEVKEMSIHPTVCIASIAEGPRGVLLYEGRGEYGDFELDKRSCIIGKSSRARLQINKDTISSVHAKIEYLDGYYIEDMNSTNGTFVNDEILNYKESRLLCPGDILRFADVKYRFL